MSRIVLLALSVSLAVSATCWQRSEKNASATFGVAFKSDGGHLSLASSDLEGVVAHFADLAGVKTIDLERVKVSQAPSPPISMAELEDRVFNSGVDATRIRCKFHEIGPATLPALIVTQKFGQAVVLLARDISQRRIYVVTRLGSHGWLPEKEVAAVFSGELIRMDPEHMSGGIWIPGHAVNAGLLPEIGDSHLKFAIFNRFRDREAEIKGVSTSCGCTSVTSHPEVIASWNIGEVELRINPAKSKSKTNFSQQVLFDVGDQKVETLQVFGKMAPSVACDPLHVCVGEIPEDGVEYLESFVYCPDPQSTTVTPYVVDSGLIYQGAELQVELSRIRLKWKLRRGRIEPNDQMRFRCGAEFLIKYPSAEGTMLEAAGTFLVHGTKVKDLLVTPRALFAGTLRPGDQWVGEVRVLSRAAPEKMFVNSSHVNDVTASIGFDRLIKVKLTCPLRVTPGFHAANLHVSDAEKCVNIPIAFYSEPAPSPALAAQEDE